MSTAKHLVSDPKKASVMLAFFKQTFSFGADTKFHSECRKVEIDGIVYDFATAEDTALAFRVMATGTPPRLALFVIDNQRIFASQLH